MEINKLLFKPIKVPVEFYYMLLRHLQYSIKDIESYDELTKEEKEIFPKDIFENYGILKYKDEYTKDFRVVGMGQFTTAQEFADYFDNESIKDVKECKYYVKDKGKIVVEEDILKDVIELVNE